MPMPYTESVAKLKAVRAKREALGGKLILPKQKRPETRADCQYGPRPCPWVGCRYHLFLEVKPNGTIAYRGTDDVAELVDMPISCALDAADKGELSQTQVGQALGVTMQAASLIEARAQRRLVINEASLDEQL